MKQTKTINKTEEKEVVIETINKIKEITNKIIPEDRFYVLVIKNEEVHVICKGYNLMEKVGLLNMTSNKEVEMNDKTNNITINKNKIKTTSDINRMIG